MIKSTTEDFQSSSLFICMDILSLETLSEEDELRNRPIYTY